MKTIPLTRGQSVIVDDSDYARLNQNKWFAKWQRGRFYAARNRSRAGGATGGTIFMHSEILSCQESKPDHVDGNTLDNRRHNLRPATYTQNNQNACLRKDSSTGFKGVSQRPDGWYYVKIQCDKKRIYLGRRRCATAAALLYDLSAKSLHGEFAKLNLGRAS